MKNTPNNRNDEVADEQPIDTTAREVAEQLDGYKDYQREARGDALNFGDY